MQMPGRKYDNGSEYRYGFNGIEKDNDVTKDDYDFGARIYDGRIGRWLSVDPLQKKYPDLTPYNFSGNSPIAFYDPNGKEIIINYKDENGKMQSLKYTPGIKPAVNNLFVQQVHEAVSYAMKDDQTKTFQALADHKKTVTINEQLTGSSSGDNINKDRTGYTDVTINWGANLGLKTKTVGLLLASTGAIAPSTILLHEAGHALGKLNVKNNAELEAAVKARKLDGTIYTNPEERRVITEIETPYILQKNKTEAKDINSITPQTQGTRDNHDGDYYPTTGVNSITPADGNTSIPGTRKTYKDEQKPKQDGTYQRRPPIN